MPIDGKILAAASYAVGFVPIVVYLTMKNDKSLRFHAVQAFLAQVGVLVFGMALLALAFVFSMVLLAIGIPLGLFVMLIAPILMFVAYLGLLFLAWKAYSGQAIKLPIIGNIAEQYSN